MVYRFRWDLQADWRRKLSRYGSCAIAALLVGCTHNSASNSALPEDATWFDVLGATVEPEWSAEEHREFDFWIGEWQMNWRRKQQGQFYHDTEGSWTQQRVFPVLDGKAIVELAWERDTPETPSRRGFSIRYFDEDQQKWVMTQNWMGPAGTGTAFVDQLIGESYHGRRTMYSVVQRPSGDGTLQTEYRRYNFTDIRPGKGFRWDGSNTSDEGKSWYTWYIVDAHYQGELDTHAVAGEPLPGVHQESLCTDAPHGAYDQLQGSWQGELVSDQGSVNIVEFTGGKLLDGCAILGVLDFDTHKSLLALGYLERFKSWVIFYLDNQPGTKHAYFVSNDTAKPGQFHAAPLLSISDEFMPYITSVSFQELELGRYVSIDQLSADGFTLSLPADPHAASEASQVYTINFKRKL
jgi:hypothetical protein